MTLQRTTKGGVYRNEPPATPKGCFGKPKAKVSKAPGVLGTLRPPRHPMLPDPPRPCGIAQAELAARDGRNQKARLIALRKGRNGKLLGLRPDLEGRSA